MLAPMPERLAHFPGPLGSLQDLRVIRLASGHDLAQALESGTDIWLQVIEGHLHACGCELHAGHGVLLTSETVLAVYAEADSLLLIAELKTSA